ncbi:sulfate transporter [Mycobacterium angelicum]|nr:sulfate transporter [Mycobacterium angelicum]
MHVLGTPEHQQHRPRRRGGIDCAGARVFVYARSLATVLRCDGEIDATNAARIGTEIRRLSRAPLILDLSRLDFLGVEGFWELLTLDREHRALGLHCTVVAGIAMRPLLRVASGHGMRVVESVPEALQVIEQALGERRQFVSDMVGGSAR